MVKVGEIEFENWGVGCVCKWYPLCLCVYPLCSCPLSFEVILCAYFVALDKMQGGKSLIVLLGCKCKYAMP